MMLSSARQEPGERSFQSYFPRCVVISTTLNKTANRTCRCNQRTFLVLFQMFFREKVAKVSLGDMLEIQERLGTKK